MKLYGLFILDDNMKYIVFSILYRHINVPMACKELNVVYCHGLTIPFSEKYLATEDWSQHSS